MLVFTYVFSDVFRSVGKCFLKFLISCTTNGCWSHRVRNSFLWQQDDSGRKLLFWNWDRFTSWQATMKFKRAACREQELRTSSPKNSKFYSFHIYRLPFQKCLILSVMLWVEHQLESKWHVLKLGNINIWCGKWKTAFTVRRWAIIPWS